MHEQKSGLVELLWSMLHCGSSVLCSSLVAVCVVLSRVVG